MTAILYPVAETAEAALHAPRGFAAREREAGRLCGGEVSFVTEAVGPAFATREAALATYAGRLVDPEQAAGGGAGAETPFTQLRPVSAPPGAPPPLRKPVKPVFRDGRRWPVRDPAKAPAVLWRLSVSYWRIAGAPAMAPEAPARRLRRDTAGRDLDARALDALARQPLRPLQPQQPLDIGLFEVRLPESPGIIVPDD